MDTSQTKSTAPESAGTASDHCPYCHSAAIRLRHAGHFHKMDRSYGPFDFYVCRNCGCGFNNPMPSLEQLKSFYATYSSGVPEEFRLAREKYEESLWHSQIAKDMIGLAERNGFRSDFTWLDVGSGAGDIALKLSKLAPAAKGACIDLHPIPENLRGKGVDWRQADINTNFARDVSGKYQLVFASAVLEHVVDPYNFLRNCLSLTERGGVLYLFCPDYSSMASRVMGTKWPYYLPGEHLTLPTQESVRRCIELIAQSGEFGAMTSLVRGKRINYSIQYMLFALHLRWLGRLLPFDFSLKFPTGALEIVITRP